MPYIKQELREELEYPLDVLSGHLESMLIDRKEDRAGILNYVITSLIDSVYGPLKDAKYRDYNEAIGMLECCKLEFYRRGVAPYEDLKERENGSVLDSNWNGSKRQISNSEADSDDIYKVELDLNTNVFIRACNRQNALNILKKILENKRFNYFLYGPYLSKYKSWDSLEPEIKNIFEAKRKNNHFILISHVKPKKDFSRQVPTEKGGTTERLNVEFIPIGQDKVTVKQVLDYGKELQKPIQVTFCNLIFSIKVNLDTIVYIRANSARDAAVIFDSIEQYKGKPDACNMMFESHWEDLDKNLKNEFLTKEFKSTNIEDGLYIIMKNVTDE